MARKRSDNTKERAGWFSVARPLLDSDLWLAEPFTRGQAWIDLIGLARFESGSVRLKGVKLDLHRGQLAWSEVKLAERFRWSKGKVRRFLGELEIDQRIVQQKSNVTSIITILNYDQYQSTGTANGTALDTPSDTAGSTPDGTADGTRKNKDNNGNNGNKLGDAPEIELPTILDSPEFRSVLGSWQAYRGAAYKPRGLSSLVSQAAKRAEQHGLAAVINAFENAMANGYQGWNFDGSFSRGSPGKPPTTTHLKSQQYQPGSVICNEL